MSAPDMDEFYRVQAERERLDILTAFVASPEWAGLHRSDQPVWTEHMLRTYWTWTVDPHDIWAESFEENRYGLFVDWSDAQPEDAATIVLELRAYFAFAQRELGYVNARACGVLISRDEAIEDLRFGLRYALDNRLRKPGCTSPVRLGQSWPG